MKNKILMLAILGMFLLAIAPMVQASDTLYEYYSGNNNQHAITSSTSYIAQTFTLGTLIVTGKHS